MPVPTLPPSPVTNDIQRRQHRIATILARGYRRLLEQRQLATHLQALSTNHQKSSSDFENRLDLSSGTSVTIQ